MNWINKIQQAIEYIENNLHEELSAEAVGKAINYAPSSFQNFFSAVTGYSIGEYIRFRRLSCAADELKAGKLSVTEIAFKYGYETSEAFSKAFKRLFGCIPSKYKAGSSHLRFSPIKINLELGNCETP